ncbi:hypothetical protein tloyanaT_20750 [Thalassotalea loyana]|uniref:Bacteriocin n=1 Tax=Thalassotalea loyana TaxID=280483 RepID=A0ABQ6HCJ7_9GAMM|nr:hypothetical protein [Thalassotalea loyana]GLX85823.1 hypothetical protein tloyanaT_20750 [Thalassotalea loyana]
MKELSKLECLNVSGGGAWDDFWESVGEYVGEFIAEQAYSAESKKLWDIGNGGDLEGFLDSQNDPLL